MSTVDSNSRQLLGAAAIGRAVGQGRLSVRQAVDDAITRIEAVNGELNAVVEPLFGRARAEATAADQRLARGEPARPLEGVPVTIKEQFMVEGTRTTLGLPSQRDWKAQADGPLVSRLRAAGAIVVGKTNLGQLMIYHESDNPLYGRTINPWNPARSPGGSSGGEAAVIASGGSALGLGGDLGGSIRVPAHFCGIHGLKPTAGRLTNDDNRLDLLTNKYAVYETVAPQQGPLARSVADLVLAMRVLEGPPGHGRPDEVAPARLGDPSELPIEDLVIGFYEDDGFFPASPGLRRAVREAATALERRGMNVVPFRPPDVARAMRLFLNVLSADGGEMFRRALGKDPVDRRVAVMLRAGKIPVPLKPFIVKGMEMAGQRRTANIVRSVRARSAEGFRALAAEVEAYRSHFLGAMDATGADVLLSPPFALPALTHGASEYLFPAASYAVLYNVLGFPAGVLSVTRVGTEEESDRPRGRDRVERLAAAVEKGSAGLPVGVQVAAKRWREDQVLAVMAALEEEFAARPAYAPASLPTLSVGRL